MASTVACFLKISNDFGKIKKGLAQAYHYTCTMQDAVGILIITETVRWRSCISNLSPAVPIFVNTVYAVDSFHYKLELAQDYITVRLNAEYYVSLISACIGMRHPDDRRKTRAVFSQ